MRPGDKPATDPGKLDVLKNSLQTTARVQTLIFGLV